MLTFKSTFAILQKLPRSGPREREAEGQREHLENYTVQEETSQEARAAEPGGEAARERKLRDDQAKQ